MSGRCDRCHNTACRCCPKCGQPMCACSFGIDQPPTPTAPLGAERERISHAEFSRFVQEATDMRAERDRLAAMVEQLRRLLTAAEERAGNLACERANALDDLEASQQRAAALDRGVRRAVSFMEDAPELWGNPAADTAIARLRALLADATGEDS